MIAKMAKYNFVLYAAQSEDFIERLRELGLVDITTSGWEPSEGDRQLLIDIEGHQKAADFITSFRADEERCDTKAAPYADGEEAYEAYESARREAQQLSTEIARLEKLADELRPWGAFDVERTEKMARKGIVLRYFSTQRSTFDKSLEEWSQNYTIAEINRSDAMVWFVVVTAPGQEVSLDAQEMKSPKTDIRGAEQEIAECRRRMATLDKEFSRVAASEQLIKAHCASLKERLQGVKVTSTAVSAADGRLLVMEGWAEEETSDKVDALLDEYPNVVYLKDKPSEEDDTPVKLKNNWFSHIFEFVGDMYARPKYGSIDLTPFFAPFYMLFFGICLNDAGYGAVLTLLGLWMVRGNKKGTTMYQAAWFATLCGLMTTVFGLLCGSAFGLQIFSNPPIDFQKYFFTWALAIGIVQIIFGMILKVVLISSTVGFKYSFGTLGWLLVVAGASIAGGLPLLNENWVIPFFTLSSPLFYAVAGVGVVMMLFLNSPGKNVFLNFGLGLWDTYNNITGILSDVLSYIRLFAIGLSGGILAIVFNDLAAGFVPEGANIVVRILIMLPVLLIGHGINLFMSVISSFVHPMRLTFVEFYKNAGFEMATRAFNPLRKMDKED